MRLTLFLGILTFGFISCTKIENDLGVKGAEENKSSNSYYSYDVSDISAIIAETKVSNKDYIPMQAESLKIEVNYDGVYSECGDGSATCLPPRNICAIIITDVAGTISGDSVIYSNSDIIKMYPDEPVRTHYEKIVVVNGDGITHYNHFYYEN